MKGSAITGTGKILEGGKINVTVYSVSDPYSSNPDPAKNPDPGRPWIQIRILAIPLHYLKKIKNYVIIISFYHQNKSIKRLNVVKVTKKLNYVMIMSWLCTGNIFYLFLSPCIRIPNTDPDPDPKDPWIRIRNTVRQCLSLLTNGPAVLLCLAKYFPYPAKQNNGYGSFLNPLQPAKFFFEFWPSISRIRAYMYQTAANKWISQYSNVFIPFLTKNCMSNI